MSKPVFEDVFAFSGRRNRQSYVLCLTAACAAMAGIFAILFLVSGGAPSRGLQILFLMASAPFLTAIWAVSAQRCRDFGWTGWTILIGAIPHVGPFFAIALCLIPGDVGPNRHGPDPRRLRFRLS